MADALVGGAGFVGQGHKETVPIMVLLLLGTGVFLTLRLGFIQIRRLGHGFKVTTGAYDDPDEPGDVSHFQALTTALSATVGIGNIAGVAIAIHWGGPGALFWMWVTAALGMATKYTEVTLAQKYRNVEETHGHVWEGTVSGGPMYYIEKGLGPKWKWMAVLFASLLGLTAFLTGNAIQANTVADTMATTFSELAGLSSTVTPVSPPCASRLPKRSRVSTVNNAGSQLIAALIPGPNLSTPINDSANPRHCIIGVAAHPTAIHFEILQSCSGMSIWMCCCGRLMALGGEGWRTLRTRLHLLCQAGP